MQENIPTSLFYIDKAKQVFRDQVVKLVQDWETKFGSKENRVRFDGQWVTVSNSINTVLVDNRARFVNKLTFHRNARGEFKKTKQKVVTDPVYKNKEAIEYLEVALTVLLKIFIADNVEHLTEENKNNGISFKTFDYKEGYTHYIYKEV